MKKIIPLLPLSILFFACSSSKKTTSNPQKSNSSSTSKNDETSYENVVLIEQRSETAGISKEYAWLKENFPGYAL